MNKLISSAYQQQLQKLHRDREDFGRSQHRWALHLNTITDVLNTIDVLDYGCGKGSLPLFMPFDINCYDPAVPEFSNPPAPSDIVFCTDVLEHVEIEHEDAVLEDLYRLTQRLLFVNINLQKASKELPDGRNAHINLKTIEEWLDQLHNVGFELEFGPERMCLNGLFDGNPYDFTAIFRPQEAAPLPSELSFLVKDTTWTKETPTL